MMEPFNGTPEQWKLYFEQQSAGIDYAAAYRDALGYFKLFSRKRAKALESARERYTSARKRYMDAMEGSKS
jgi:hypothetical protein